MSSLPNLELAIKIAVDAHFGQTDKADAPYILHPLRVMSACDSVDEKTVAVLHDVLEDCDVTAQDLIDKGFPVGIVEAIECLTRLDSESYEQFIDRVATNPIARTVKISDLRDNLKVERLGTITAKDTDRLNKYLAALRSLGV